MASVDAPVRTKRREPIDLSGAHIPGTSLSYADLIGADFKGANLAQVNFEGSDLRGANFCEAKLTGANLTRANLSGVNFRMANLKNATLRNAILDGADLAYATLSNTEVGGSDISGVKGITWSQFLECNFDDATVWPAYLQEEELLDLLERIDSAIGWRREYAGKLSALLAELAALKKRTRSDSILNLLVQMRVEREMNEQPRRRDD